MKDIIKEIDVFGLTRPTINMGGRLVPLLIPLEPSKSTGLMNPSIYNDQGELWMIMRHVNYALYHSEKRNFHHTYGPLQYIHPEDDRTLTTWNYLCKLDDVYNITNHWLIDTSKYNVKPLWTFVGLEDARLIKWDNKWYGAGVRRDTTTNGQGRMELSELEITDQSVKEVSRWRIPPPKEDTYCEKNWVPILDMPYHFIKWTNPTEVVKIIPEENRSETTILDETNIIPINKDLRGSSHVLSWKNHYITITHELDFFKTEMSQKNAKYRHRFVIWDKEWNIVNYSNPFSFLKGEIEFCAGMSYRDNKFLITFGYQDNMSFLLEMPEEMLNYVLLKEVKNA